MSSNQEVRRDEQRGWTSETVEMGSVARRAAGVEQQDEQQTGKSRAMSSWDKEIAAG